MIRSINGELVPKNDLQLPDSVVELTGLPVAHRGWDTQNECLGATMPMTETQAAASGGMPLPLLAAADLQDHLMVASNDLERLQRLLDDAKIGRAHV